MILTNPRERTRFFRFAIVGAIGALVDFGIYNILVDFFFFSIVLAGIISFLTAVVSNFTWNRFWTYPDSRSKSLLRQGSEFLVINAMGLLIRIPILAYFDIPMRHTVAYLMQLMQPATQNSFLSPNTLGDNLTLAIAIGIVMLWNFFANRYWTYADVK